MSPPAQNDLPSALMTSAPTSGLASTSSNVAIRSSAIAGVSALRRSGAFSVTIATPPSTSSSTSPEPATTPPPVERTGPAAGQQHLAGIPPRGRPAGLHGHGSAARLSPRRTTLWRATTVSPGLDGRMADARVRRRLSTPLLAMVLCLVWSSAFIFVKLALRDAPAEVFAALRALAAAPVLLVALLIRDAAGLVAALRRPRVHLIGLVLGATSVAGFLIFSTLGLELSGIGFGVVLIYSQPLLVAGMARLALGERLSARQVAGLFLGWAGIGVAVLDEVSGADAGPHVWEATLLFLGTALCFAVGTVVVKAVTAGPRAVPLPPALLLALVYGSVPLIGFATTADEPVHWTGSLVGSVLYAGVISLAVGYLLQFALLERGDAGVVSSYTFAVPILAALYGVLIFDEKLSVGLVVGALAVAVAILLVTVPGRPRVLEETP